MNYLTEIQGFYTWLMINPQPTSTIVLWHALMHVNNKCGWIQWFTVANVTLKWLTGLSRQTLFNTRQKLVQQGLIECKKGSRNQCAQYRLIPFNLSALAQKNSPKSPDILHGALHSPLQGALPLNKQNKTKRNQNPLPSPQGEEDADGFAAFWASYPKKVAKQQAIKAWQKLKPDKALQATLLKALERAGASPQWQKDAGQYIPHAASWLNARRFEDELDDNGHIPPVYQYFVNNEGVSKERFDEEVWYSKGAIGMHWRFEDDRHFFAWRDDV